MEQAEINIIQKISINTEIMDRRIQENRVVCINDRDGDKDIDHMNYTDGFHDALRMICKELNIDYLGY